MIPQIRFTTDQGTVQIAGGVSPLLSPSGVSGLTLPEKETVTAVFKNIAGQKLISVRDKKRTVKIEGIAEGDLKKAARLLYLSGVLVLETERMKRVIGARCTHLLDRTTDGKISLVFECDSPYFHDDTDISVPVYSRVKLVKTPFTLPCVFTGRIREGNCKNESAVASEPKIIVSNKGETLADGFEIRNLDTGVSLVMTASIPSGKGIEIDIGKREAVSTDGENQLPFLSETSYLHEFILMPGDNRIVFSAKDGVECEVVYNTNYTEAVI